MGCLCFKEGEKPYKTTDNKKYVQLSLIYLDKTENREKLNRISEIRTAQSSHVVFNTDDVFLSLPLK